MSSENMLTIEADGASDYLKLAEGLNKVTIGCPALAAGCTAILQTSTCNFLAGDIFEHPDPLDPEAKAQLTDAHTETDGGVGREFTLIGPGQVRLYVDGFADSDPITLKAFPATRLL